MDFIRRSLQNKPMGLLRVLKWLILVVGLVVYYVRMMQGCFVGCVNAEGVFSLIIANVPQISDPGH